MFDIRIYTFLAVCDCMNFTKAAQQLHITQPAVSQHIHYLEEYYHTKLFEYHGRKLSLTQHGEMLLKMATTFINDNNFFKRYVTHETRETLPMIFGVTKTIGEFVISTRFERLVNKYPKADMRMMIDNNRVLLEGLRNGELHFALIEGYYDEEEFEHINYSVERFVCVCSSKHEFRKKPELMRDLVGETLILREKGSGTRNILERNLGAKNMSIDDFRRKLEIDSMHVIRNLVVEDCGITFLYEAAVRDYIEKGMMKIVELQDFQMEHEFTFVWNKGSVFSDFFISVCKELMKDE